MIDNKYIKKITMMKNILSALKKKKKKKKKKKNGLDSSVVQYLHNKHEKHRLESHSIFQPNEYLC